MGDDDGVLDHGASLRVARSVPPVEVMLNARHEVVCEQEAVELHRSRLHPLRTTEAVPRRQLPEHGRDGHLGVTLTTFLRRVELKHPQAVPAAGMDGVVEELPQRDVLRADVRVERRALGMLQHAIPEPEVRAASDVIMPDDVIGVRDPEPSRRDIVVH